MEARKNEEPELRILYLTLKREPFVDILEGRKKIEEEKLRRKKR